MRRQIRFSDIIACVVLIVLAKIADDINTIKRSIHQTEVKANSVQELFKYWFPPLKETRLKDQCGRCHK